VTDEGNGEKVDFLWDNDLDRAFKRFDTDRIVFVFDSCVSGGMTELAKPGRIILMATTKTGLAVEAGVFDGIEINHGLFTFFLLGALSGAVPEADTYDQVPGVPDVTVEEAYNFASYQLISLTPTIQEVLTLIYGPDVAALWGTPTVMDWFWLKDMLP
jgi:hypothetical protein